MAETSNEPRRRRRRGLGSIQTKLLLMLLLTAVLAALVVGFFGYRSGTQSLRDATNDRVTEVGDERLAELQDFIANQESAVRLDSQGQAVASSRAFNSAFALLGASSISAEQGQALQDFYADSFVPRLDKTTGESYQAEAFVPSTPAGRYLLANYTATAATPGARAADDDAGDGSAWSAANAAYNPYWRAVTDSLGLDDVLMLDNSGNIVYSANKGPSLGSNVLTGDYRGGALQRVYQKALRSNSLDAVEIEDFEPFLPAYGAPRLFIASPIGTTSQLSGVLVYEVSAAKVNAILSGTSKVGDFRGLGDSGEAYLVGPDGTLRTDSRELFDFPEDFRKEAVAIGNEPDTVDRMLRTKSTILLLRDKSRAAVLGGRGQSGLVRDDDYLGFDTLAAYQPADIDGLDWTIVTKIDAKEALAPVNDFARDILIATAVVVLLICAASVLMARVFTSPVDQLLRGVRKVAGGRLGARVDTDSRSDEFGDLGAAFNDMSDRLLTKQQLLDAQLAENTRLLHGLMPASVVERYQTGETEIAAEREDVSVVYVHVDGFDAFAGDRPAADSRELLAALTHGFEQAAARAGIEKVRGLGAGYVGSSGLVVQRVDHARRVVDFAIDAADMLRRFNSQHGSRLGLRAGIDAGPVRGGLVGSTDLVYDLWGEAVDLALRVRASGSGAGIFVTDRIKRRLGSGYEFIEAGTVEEDKTGRTIAVWKIGPSA